MPIDILNLIVRDFVIVLVYQPVTEEHQHHIIVEIIYVQRIQLPHEVQILVLGEQIL